MAEDSTATTDATSATGTSAAGTSAQEVVDRISALNERLLSVAGPAGAQLLAAHEKAMQRLAEFAPRDTADATAEWFQTLAAAHATFLSEASANFVGAARKAGEAAAAQAESVLDQDTVDRIRSLNDEVVTRLRSVGENLLDGYEKVLSDISDFEVRTSKASAVEWVEAVGASHARFLTEVGSIYSRAARSLLGTATATTPAKD